MRNEVERSPGAINKKMETIGIGVIGCGGMGRSLATSAHAVEGIEVICVSDLQEALAEKLAADLNASYVLDYHELLADDRIQAVLIASPPFMHSPMVVDAANAGKHIFSEKPMAPTLSDCDAMIAAAEENDVKLTIGLVCRYHATHSAVRGIVQSGELGAPACMMVHRIGGPWRSGGSYVPWRLERAKSGGSLMEINAHEIDFMRWTCGDVVFCLWCWRSVRPKRERLPGCRACFTTVRQWGSRSAPLQPHLRYRRIWRTCRL